MPTLHHANYWIAIFLSLMFYLCEAAFAVVAIKSNVQNQHITENEGVQYDCQI